MPLTPNARLVSAVDPSLVHHVDAGRLTLGEASRIRGHLHRQLSDQTIDAEADRLASAAHANRPRTPVEHADDELERMAMADDRAGLLDSAHPAAPPSQACDLSTIRVATASGGGPGGSGGAGRVSVPRLPAEPASPAAVRPASILIHEHKAVTHPLDTSDDPSTRTVEQRIDHYTVCHQRTVEMAEYFEANCRESIVFGRKADHVAHDLRRCGAILHFREYAAIDESRLMAGKFCGFWKCCPLCATRRTARMIRAYAPKVAAAVAGKALRPYLLTLTIRNGDTLSERFEHLVDSWRRWQETRRNAQKSQRGQLRHVWTELVHAESIAFSYEVKRGRNSGSWHPHLHAMLLCHQQPDAEAMSREWHRITGDSHVIDLRPFHCTEALATAEPDRVVELLSGDLVELLKYALKFSDLDHRDTHHAAEYLRCRRLVGTIGPSLRGVEVPTCYLDAPLEADDLPYVEAVATWHGRGYAIERNTNHQVPEPGGREARTHARSPRPVGGVPF